MSSLRYTASTRPRHLPATMPYSDSGIRYHTNCKARDIPGCYPIDSDMQIKTNYIAFVKACVEQQERLNAGEKGFWHDAVQDDGTLKLDGNPHGIFKLVPAENSADEVA